jgi:allantoinase
MHVHISDGAETFRAGSKCAAVGGITTVMDMAPFHGCVTPEQYRQKVDQAEGACVVDFGLVAGIVVSEKDLSKLGELAQMGASYFKVFMPGNPPVTPTVLWKSVKVAAHSGLRLGIHAEEIACINPEVDWSNPLGFARSRPYVAESSAVAQVVEMAKAAGAPIHICHVSARQTVDIVATSKAKGVDVTAEVPPHFLLFDESEFSRQGARVKTTPPLRSKEDNKALWHALREGVIDALACDHFLGSLEPASKDYRKMQEAAAGIGSLELSLPLMFDAGVAEERLSLERFVEITSQQPAEICGISDRKGQIVVGKDADLILIDPEAIWKVVPQGEFSRNATSPYLGRQLRGRIKRTLVRGKTVWNDNKIQAQDGWGKYQPSKYRS